MTKYVLFNPKGLCESYSVNGESHTLKRMETAELSQVPDYCTPGIRMSEVEVQDEESKKKKKNQSPEESSEE